MRHRRLLLLETKLIHLCVSILWLFRPSCLALGRRLDRESKAPSTVLRHARIQRFYQRRRPPTPSQWSLRRRTIVCFCCGTVQNHCPPSHGRRNAEESFLPARLRFTSSRRTLNASRFSLGSLPPAPPLPTAHPPSLQHFKMALGVLLLPLYVAVESSRAMLSYALLNSGAALSPSLLTFVSHLSGSTSLLFPSLPFTGADPSSLAGFRGVEARGCHHCRLVPLQGLPPPSLRRRILPPTCQAVPSLRRPGTPVRRQQRPLPRRPQDLSTGAAASCGISQGALQSPRRPEQRPKTRRATGLTFLSSLSAPPHRPPPPLRRPPPLPLDPLRHVALPRDPLRRSPLRRSSRSAVRLVVGRQPAFADPGQGRRTGADDWSDDCCAVGDGECVDGAAVSA